jgi:hypothetical protein
MMTTSKEIIAMLREDWPEIQINWLADARFVLPSIEEVEKLLPLSKVRNLRFDGELADCDDYALELHAWVKRYRRGLSDSLPPGERYHWAFGEVLGTCFRGVEQIHSINICVAEEGIFFIEPQTYEVWKGSPQRDNPLMIKM